MKLLISGVGRRNALIRLIREEAEKYKIDIIGSDADECPPAIIEFGEFSVLPRVDSNDFTESLKKLIISTEINAALTLIDPEIPLLSQCSHDLNLICFHPSADVSLLCEDKYLFSVEASLSGIPVVETSLSPFQVFPFIKKDRRGSAASGFRLINKDTDYTVEDTNVESIYQPFCNGQHYCIDAYFSVYTNQLIDLCVKQVLNKKYGEAYVLQSVNAERFLPLILQLSNWINLKGIVNFDVYDENGQLKIMDINCRFGGNYPASHAFGCNLLYYMFKELVDRTPVSQKFSKYQEDKIVVKYFDFSTPFDL